MKIMRFNTQHCLDYLKQEIDFDTMAGAIKRIDPDIVGLQEMRSVGKVDEYADQTGILASLTDMPYHFFAKAIDFPLGPYGNALISKHPILKAESILIPDPFTRLYDGYYETRCVLKATLEGGITVLVSHFGLNPDEAENAVNTVLANIADEKCILMGDFNLDPDSPLLDPIRARMKDTADLFGSPLLSCPSDFPNRKIDYIFVSPDIEVVTADIPEIIASDHRPHIANIKI